MIRVYIYYGNYGFGSKYFIRLTNLAYVLCSHTFFTYILSFLNDSCFPSLCLKRFSAKTIPPKSFCAGLERETLLMKSSARSKRGKEKGIKVQ